VTFLRSAGLGTTNLLGLNVDGDRFLSDAIKESYADLLTTIEDAKRLRTPALFFAAERDPWTQLDAVKKVLASLQTHAGQLYLIPDALHRLQDNPRQTLALVRQVASCCVERFFPDRFRKGLVEPSLRTIAAQTRLERERARARHSKRRPALREFWQAPGPHTAPREHLHLLAFPGADRAPRRPSRAGRTGVGLRLRERRSGHDPSHPAGLPPARRARP